MLSYRRLTAGCNLPIPNEPILGREYKYKKQKALTSWTLRGAAHGDCFLSELALGARPRFTSSLTRQTCGVHDLISARTYENQVHFWHICLPWLNIGNTICKINICVRIPVPRSICLYIHTFYSLHTFTQFLRRRGNPRLNQPLQKSLNYFMLQV